MSRMNLISPRAGRDGKTHWHKVGAAFPRDKGGYSLVFDSLPLPDKEGRVSLLMVEPNNSEGGQRQDSGHGGGGGQGGSQGGGFRNDLDGDDIPFFYEWRV